jgi:hypothetical protein
MERFFLFNSPPRSGNVFLFFLFSKAINEDVTKCLDIKKYSDLSQRQAAFFRNPYDSIASTIIKTRVDAEVPLPSETNPSIGWDLKIKGEEYLSAIREAKKNFDNLYIGISEEMMKDPILTINNIAIFFDLKLKDSFINNSQKVLEEIKEEMFNTKKTRLNQEGKIIVENLMTDHDGHLPREKTKERVFLDKLIRIQDSSILKECYYEYLNLKTTNVKENQKWKY